MPLCPNCLANVNADAESCAACGVLFSGEGCRPIDREVPENNTTSAAGIIAKLGLASVLIPAAGFLIGLILSNIIPGCHCDEGAGCGGCGANGLVSFLLFGGFVGGLGALLTVLPASLLLAVVVSIFSKRS